VFSVAVLLLGTPWASAQLQASLRLEKDAVMARGKWSPSDAKADEVRPHLPLVEIHCFKIDNFCMQATARVRGNEPSLAVVYYQVIHWDKKGILAENEDFSCTTNQLTIDFKDSTVTATDLPRKKGKKVAEAACKTLPQFISYNLIGEFAEVSEKQADSPPAR
jgi:hypothetical protein